MASENETIADIVAEFREMVHQSVDGIIAVKADVIADRIEAAWKLQMSQSWNHREMTELVARHEREVAELKKLIPQPDPEWEAICERCRDGDLEPDCEYYGEPNGCNSPIYGEHPKAQPVGNAEALREALELCLKYMCKYCRSGAKASGSDVPCLNGCQMLHISQAALSAPPRNCDLARDWLQDLYCNFKPPATVRREMPPEWVDAVMAFCKWLLAPAAERKGEGDGSK